MRETAEEANHGSESRPAGEVGPVPVDGSPNCLEHAPRRVIFKHEEDDVVPEVPPPVGGLVVDCELRAGSRFNEHSEFNEFRGRDEAPDELFQKVNYLVQEWHPRHHPHFG
ncbi:MAG: hypothetical protein HWN65_04940 [Candidatus Helarchaeota archaeon]|nr:hypothetical protein [Candidatus Helarchaeota archaeon]